MVTFENVGSTPSRHICSALGCSSKPTAPDPTSRSLSSTTAASSVWKLPGSPAISDAHFPGHRLRALGEYTTEARTAAETEFLSIGDGART